MKEFVRRVTFTSSLIFLLVFSSFITLFFWQSRSLAQGTIPSNFQNSADKFNGTPTSAEEIREAIERKRTLSRVRRQTDLLQEEVEITSDVKAPSPDVASTIEKAFRIQYSDLILRQLGLLEHIEKPSEALIEKPSEALIEKPSEALIEKPSKALIEKPSEALIEKPSAPLIEKPSPALIEKHLTQFGYDFFRPQELRRSTNIVLPGDYVLGPGDVLRVNMWGSGTDVELDGEVRPDGTITLPRLGIIPVAGIRYGDIKTIIAKEADKYIQGVNISVVIVRPRSLEIYVVGQVKNPGLRIIPAFSTVLNALIEAGGPLKVGSLRKIVISRKGKVFRRLDLYDLILKGDTKDDVLLEDKDVVYVPYIGPTVAVIGAVHRPAIFELKDKKSTLEKVLNYTGGPLAQAHVKLNLRRFERNQALEVLDVALNDPKMKKIKVLDGDLVEVRYIGHKFPRAVKVTGHVWDMMEFTFREGMRLSEVISNKGIVKPGAITKYALLRRYDQATSEYSIEEIPLTRIWEKEFDLPLRAYDEIIILSQEEFGIKTEVYLRGAVWSPGDYEFRPGMALKDVIALGGGLKEWAGRTEVEITRQSIVKDELVSTHIKLDIAGQEAGFKLQPFDMIRVPVVKGAGLVREVEISGEVRFPGKYAISKDEKLSNLIIRAGGLLDSAYLYGAEYLSQRAQAVQQQSIQHLINEMEVRLSGDVLGAAAAASDPGAAGLARSQQEALNAFLLRLKSIKATGRVAIKLVELETFKMSSYDFELEQGDLLIIPSKPAFVSVLGSVYAPNSYLYRPNNTVGDYLNLAGGLTKNADREYISLHKANGEVIGLPSIGSRRFHKQRLMPGDTILVSEDLDRVPSLRFFKDIADVVYKITLAVGVAAGVFF
jgi:protein involved in polysaccharide export with SLBB domain